ncbi:MAG: class I SAM-dependent methyltransferase [Alphaproteobacteria bacterium]|nr:MAG: class I SAM-dependent methyltransferase [Alphaproteobacteria bacterium]
MAENAKTKEPQYQICLDYRDKRGLERLGLMSSQSWYDDPKRLVFMLARYKFVAKMLQGASHVLEVGCADAFGTRIVRQEVGALTAVDFDPVFIADAETRASDRWSIDLRVHDVLEGPVPGRFDAVFALDVLEHIQPADEHRFLTNMTANLVPYGTCIIGIPSLESQPYASPASREGHVNCKTMPDLKTTMQRYFHNVFMFSMNDEMVHTGYHKMAHYLFALCCGRRDG